MIAKFLLNRRVQFVFPVALGFLLLVGVFTYHVLNKESESNQWVQHSHEVINNFAKLDLDIAKIAARSRRFLLTGEEPDADALHASEASAEQRELMIRSLTLDNAAQQRRLSTITALLAERVQLAETAVTLRRAKGLEAAADEIRGGQSREVTVRLEAVVHQAQDDEEQLLSQRNADAAMRLGQSKIALMLGTCFGLLITITAFWDVLRDNSRRRLAEVALFAEKETAEVTLKSIGDAVLSADIAGNITFLNLVAEKMTGWSWQEADGRPLAEVFRPLDATTRDPAPDQMEMAVRQDQIVHLPPNCILVRRDGFEAWIEESVSPIHDREGGIAGAVINFRDVSAARSMALELTHSAEHDLLTGLPNQVLLGDRITVAIASARRHNNTFAVLFLDLDNFKHINDSLGHPLGDKLLQSVAVRLVNCARGTDTVSRQGGDEFVILLTDVEEPEDSALTARRMLQAVAEPHLIDGHDLHITASIGVSVYPDDGLDAETLIKNADTALYQAKENGRQGYQFFKPEMNVRAVERQFIEEGLRRALERQEFVLHYQPIIDLMTGEITGAEALIRWMHPTRGLVPPIQFISVAEDCGLIVPIGAWVLRTACLQARAWVDAGLPKITMAVNASALEFRNENFLDHMFAVISETDMDPRFLVLELTEGVLMKHAELATSILQSLRERGVKVAIDDFGTGFSSLSYLRKFPLDALKIDQSFVRQIDSAGGDTTIVAAVIALARSLKLRVIAEGAEVSAELKFLRAHHCDEVQGYYFSRPVVAEQFAKLLETGIPEPDDAPQHSSDSEPGTVKVWAA
jgi:diguanylate cyclase (GGDEF)-like protein/PAS domain S-box-containing protein